MSQGRQAYLTQSLLSLLSPLFPLVEISDAFLQASASTPFPRRKKAGSRHGHCLVFHFQKQNELGSKLKRNKQTNIKTNKQTTLYAWTSALNHGEPFPSFSTCLNSVALCSPKGSAAGCKQAPYRELQPQPEMIF